jgi:hypothetical protein
MIPEPSITVLGVFGAACLTPLLRRWRQSQAKAVVVFQQRAYEATRISADSGLPAGVLHSGLPGHNQL